MSGVVNHHAMVVVMVVRLLLHVLAVLVVVRIHAVEVQQVIPVQAVLMIAHLRARKHVRKHAKTLVLIHVKGQHRVSQQQVRLTVTNM